MRFILAIAAGLLQLSGAFVLPRPETSVAGEPHLHHHMERATDSDIYFPPNELPQLYKSFGQQVAEGETFSYGLIDKGNGEQPIVDIPGLQYYLAAVPDRVAVNLYTPPQPVPNDSRPGFVKVGQIAQPFDESPTKFGFHLMILDRFANGTDIPNGEYHVGLVAFKDEVLAGQWISPVFKVQRNSTTDN